MTHANSAAFDDWINEARSITVAAELRRRGIPALQEINRPCPACGGKDRFAINTRKNIFICRSSGAGGDAIALCAHLDGTSFLASVETLTRRPPPGRLSAETPDERLAREHRLAARQEELARRDAFEVLQADGFREQERKRCHDIWRKSRAIAGTIVEAYLARRGLAVFPELRLGYLADQPLWDKPPPHGRIVHRGPCMVAPILRRDGTFGGVHMTWIDLDQSDGKAMVSDPTTGEFMPAKKVRGSKRGGRIEIGRNLAPRVLLLGEGIETVTSVRQELARYDRHTFGQAVFWSGIDLGNIAGKAKRSVAHPTSRMVDTAGRERAVRVPGPEPVDDGEPPLPVPDTIEHLILLRDMDSEPVMTGYAMRRAAARFASVRPDLLITEWRPRPGLDFNDALREKVA